MACCVLLLLLLGGLTSLARAQAVGFTPSDFSVQTFSGSVSHSIPITLPPGTGGMLLPLTVTYSSQASGGFLGIGYSLSGFSVITRCGATLATDGQIDPVDFDNLDRFCLDGERLIIISGVYGADASVYRPEHEDGSFLRVTAKGIANGAPVSFEVRTKAGLLQIYGGTLDSRIEAPGTANVLSWALSRVSDTLGTSVDVAYSENTSLGEYVPLRIDYSSHAASGLTSNVQVRFGYRRDRPDQTPTYISGSRFVMTALLTSIGIYVNGAPKGEYRLSYQSDTFAGRRSHLVSVLECAASGACLAPITLQWHALSAPPVSFASARSVVAHRGTRGNNFVGDFDGDGRSDLIAYSDGINWHICVARTGGFVCGYWQGHSGGTTNNFLGDFNGDGKTDIMAHSGGSTWHVALSTGSNFQPLNAMWTGGDTADPRDGRTLFGDFTGDGRTDHMHHYLDGSVWRTRLYASTGASPFAPVVTTEFQSTSSRIPRLGDFDNDGRLDLIVFRSGRSWDVCVAAVNFRCAPWDGHGGGMDNLLIGDFNGDHLADIAGYNAQTQVYDVCVSNGASAFVCTPGGWVGPASDSAHTHVGDFNGDGFSDLLGYEGSRWRLTISTGSSFSGLGDPRSTGLTPQAGAFEDSCLLDFNGDGKLDTAYHSSGSSSWSLWLAQDAPPDLLKTIAYGNGISTTINYLPLTDARVHTSDAVATYPRYNFRAPVYVVSSVTTTDSDGLPSTKTYAFFDAEMNLAGRGFRGFRSVTTADSRSDRQETYFYQQDQKYNGLMLGNLVTVKGQNVEFVENTLQSTVDQGVYFAYVSRSVATQRNLDGVVISVVTTDIVMDANGDATQISRTWDSDHTEVTRNTFFPAVNGIAGRLKQSTVTKTAPGFAPSIRTSAFSYDSVSGLISAEETEPSSAFSTRKTYNRDAYGNILQSSLTAFGISAPFTTRTTYDAKKRYVESTTNALGQQSQAKYDERYGVPLWQQDVNGLRTNFGYDDFGRRVRETRPDGTSTQDQYFLCSDPAARCPTSMPFSTAAPRYMIRTTGTGLPLVEKYYNSADQVVRVRRQLAFGRFSLTDFVFNTTFSVKGFAQYESTPYFEGSLPQLWTHTQKDPLGRTFRVIHADGSVTTIASSGRATITTDSLGSTKREEMDSLGRTVRVVDAQDNAITSQFDSAGNEVRIRDPSGNVIAFTYNLVGQRIQIQHPDSGKTTSVFDAMGNLLSVTNANATTISYKYDLLGRVVEEAAPEGTSTWQWDTKPNGKGHLSRVASSDGFAEEYNYDSFGRLTETSTGHPGQAPLIQYREYNREGKLQTYTYPSGYKVLHKYGSDGSLLEIVESQSGKTLWKLVDVDPSNRITSELFGNGVSVTRTYDPATGALLRVRATTAAGATVQDLAYNWDTAGNLVRRRDNLQSVQESFRYDSLHRLLESKVYDAVGSVLSTQTVAYDPLGNIVSKSDVGTYRYSPGRPHAVDSITTATRNDVFTYDANGNQLRAPGRFVSYSSLNRPFLARSTEGTYSTRLFYTPNHDRYRKEVTLNDDIYVTLYIGDSYEVEYGLRGPLHKHYVRTPSGIPVVHVIDGHTGVHSNQYLLQDHLGSAAVVLDDAGTILDRFSFDAWGKRRGSDWKPLTIRTFTSPFVSPRGYTGHEHFDEVDIVHMNGRIYDPTVGRFLNVDATIQDESDLQNLNAYSYVLNRPLVYTDPSGFLFSGVGKWWKKHKAEAASVAGMIVGYMIGGPFGAGFGGSFAGTLAVGGSFGDALLAGARGGAYSTLQAGLSFGVGDLYGHETIAWSAQHAVKILAHGSTSALVTSLQGGKWEHGFISAAFTEIATPGIRSSERSLLRSNNAQIAAAAVIGGTASAIGGGKFSNGALTGAFMYIYNANGGESGDELVKIPPGVSLDDNFYDIYEDRWPWKAGKWFDKVRPGGEWDYKRLYDDASRAGNKNYGVTSAALGLPEFVAVLAGGAVKSGTLILRGDFKKFTKLDAYGNYPEDTSDIRAGYAYGRKLLLEAEKLPACHVRSRY